MATHATAALVTVAVARKGCPTPIDVTTAADAIRSDSGDAEPPPVAPAAFRPPGEGMREPRFSGTLLRSIEAGVTTGAAASPLLFAPESGRHYAVSDALKDEPVA